MPKLSEMLPSKFLKMQEGDPARVFTIKAVKLETVSKDNEPKKERWTAQFRETDKPLVLNSTNLKRIAKAFGNDSDAWTGKRIEVYFDPDIEFGGEIVGGIRVRCQAQTAAQPGEQPKSDFNDDIPF